MYRDDTCAVCDESLPPDHFYCRDHAAEVDDRLHAIAESVGQVRESAAAAAQIVARIAEQTWDWLAARDPSDPTWPPAPEVALRVPPEQIEVDVDAEPGLVRATLRLPVPDLLAAVAAGLDDADVRRWLDASAAAEGLNATH